MADPQVSPISQLLHTLGITREDLMKRSDQMRQFLTAEDAMSSRVFDRDTSRPRSGSDLLSNARSVSSTRSLARSLSRASSNSVRDCTPPTTPVKTEPHEILLPPHRRMDSMEMIIERQRRKRKSRKERERETSKNRPHPPSPSPSNASHSGSSHNSVVQFRDEAKAYSLARESASQNAPEESVIVEPPPFTPQKNKYYREHTNLTSTQLQQLNDGTYKSQTPTPTRAVPQVVPQGQALPQYYTYPAYIGYPHHLPMAYRALQASSSAIPITPQAQRIQTFPPGFPPSKPSYSPLPSSSPPPPASSPVSSPARRVVNLVSSPGPMGPDPRDNEYDNLPYRLPPGPYLTTKPDLSYAALIGRAILSSPEHRLTLQEIYDWITIVYPYYKRGETTWMNSIRHVLSTTVVFRKVPRDRSVGRTLWAIYDEDIECFKDGGFKKQFCRDYVNGSDNRDKGKGKARKRADDDDGNRRAKKPRKEQMVFGSSGDSGVVHSSFLAWNNLGHPLFPPRPTTHLQPYYPDVPQPAFPTIPADIIFPPLPPSAALNRIMSGSSSASVSVSRTDDSGATESTASTPPTTLRSSPVPPSISSATSSSSVPELTPHRSSSSPPSSMPATSDLDVDMHAAHQPSESDGVFQSICSAMMADPQSEESTETLSSVVVDADAIFNTTLLGPVKYWRDPPKASDALQPGLDILGFIDDSDHENSSSKEKVNENVRPQKMSALPPIPISPTLNLRAIQSRSNGSCRPTTPLSSIVPPSTPPRSTHKISSIRTPISHKGLNMSPSTSLAHYKSNLDPPPVVIGGVAPLAVSQEGSMATAAAADEVDPHRTPRKRANFTNAPSIFGNPMTPKKLFSSAGDSPFRTPLGGSTPRRMFDPHDPRAMLDDELNRMNTYDDSPAGLYGKDRLLYDSPGFEGYKWW